MNTTYVQAPAQPAYVAPVAAAPVAVAPVVAPPAPGISLGEAAVAVGAGMAFGAMMDAIAPSPEKVMQNQMKEDERKLDEQSRKLDALKAELSGMAVSK